MAKVGRPPMKKIHERYLRRVAKLLFDRETLTGGALARRMGRNYFVIRRWLKVDGIVPEEAHNVASIMEEWANELRDEATNLRYLAHKVEGRS